MHSQQDSQPHGEENGEIKYWRSVDYRRRTLDYVNSIRDEFRAGDSEITGLQRREMLKLMGASMALAGIGTACRRPEEKILPYSKAPEDVVPGVPNYFATARDSIFGATGLIVESHENRPTKIEGNPDHPMSLGAASSHDQASVLELYDPDRSRAPRQKQRSVLSPVEWKEWDSFAAEHMKSFASSKGEGLSIVYEGHGSPTQERLLREMKAAMPAMQIYAYDPMQEVNTAQGAKIAFGEDARVLMNFDKAKVILTVHADPFMKGPAALKNARGFAQGRKISSALNADTMNRLYSVEAQYSVTGTNADHRLRAPVSQGGDFLIALAKQLGKTASGSFTLADAVKAQLVVKPDVKFDVKYVAALAKDLLANAGRSLIVVGECQEPWVHALGHAMNAALGALGQTVQVVKATKGAADHSGFDGLSKLAFALNQKKVTTLVLLNTNLAYASPGALQLKEAMVKAQTLIHVGAYVDESANLATWHLPLSHFLEAYGDAIGWDGTASIQQPLIAPLHNTRSSIEILAQLQSGLAQKGYEVVQATWRGAGAALATDKSWRSAVHDGVIAGSKFVQALQPKAEAAALASEIAKAKPGTVPSSESLELVFDFDHRLLDGRLANLGWMQELPDPITKLTWGNALYVSPALAKKIGLLSRVKDRFYHAEVVTVVAKGRSLDVPTFVVPGLAESTVVAILGFGRTQAGTLGSNVGYDAFDLLPVSGTRVVQGVTLKRTGKTVDLASTQEQFAMNAETIQEVSVLSMQNRDPARVADLKAYKADPKYAEKKGLPDKLLHKEDDGTKKRVPKQVTDPWPYTGNKWGMVIDLTSCIGCNACVTACQSENNIPVVGKEQVMRARSMHWIRIDRYFTGDVNEPMAIAQPVPCMHCENAPCEPVCPVAATAHDKEGLNAMSYNRCVGTRYCGNNCPYKVRRFNYLDFSHSGNLYVDSENKERSKLLSMQANPDVTIRYRGVMEKCTYCVQRIQEAKITATRHHEDPNAIKDGAVTPACAQTCPTQAITFGNLNDPESRVSKLKLIDRNYDMLNELNVRPRTSYLGKLRNPNPELV